MASFAVTFRLQSGPDYNDRYNSLMEKITSIAPDGTWGETSSFIAFSCSSTLDEVYDVLCMQSGFDPRQDTMLIIDVFNRKKKTAGLISYPRTLDSCLGF